MVIGQGLLTDDVVEVGAHEVHDKVDILELLKGVCRCECIKKTNHLMAAHWRRERKRERERERERERKRERERERERWLHTCTCTSYHTYTYSIQAQRRV